jgi:uncharacterized Rossmann fold enzyme
MLEQSWYFKEFYKRVAAKQLGFDPSRDSIATQYISNIIECNRVEKAWKKILELSKNNEALIVGPAFNRGIHGPLKNNVTIIGADGSSLLFYHNTGKLPDITVSDLDGPFILYNMIVQHDKWIVVHSHGDNIYRLAMLSNLLEYDKALFTTQTEDYKCITNIGGFTDGDRAIMLAVLLGFNKIRVCCFTREPVSLHKETTITADSRSKRTKLELANQVIGKIKDVYRDRIEFIS